MTQITTFASRAALMEAAAAALLDAIETGLRERGAACVALSGGTTPAPAYEALAVQPLDWPNVTFCLVDERFVPASHEASNEGMLRRALAPALAAGAKLAPMYAPGDIASATHIADARYAELHIDIALMGMGADGHTASWFDGAKGLAQALDVHSASTVVAVEASQAYGSAERLTLTRAAIARCARVLLLITGDEKRALLQDVWDGRIQAPIAHLFTPPIAPQTIWAA